MSERPITLNGKSGRVKIERNEAGVAHITATDIDESLFGLGFCHARDRGLQMLIVRILGRGEASELLQSTDELLALDRFFRRANLSRDLRSEEAALSDRSRSGIEAYCQGVNRYFETAGIPWELRLFGYKRHHRPWSIADICLTAKVIGYLSLAQSQSEMERFIIECVQRGISREKLEEFFPGQLNGLDETLVRQLHLQERIVPDSIKWAHALPRAMASNNWVVSGAKTASGKPMLCNDPHLEVNRLPAIWYEAVLRWPTPGGPRYVMGGTMPGVPGVISGRTPDLAWGVTYAFMDNVDSWIEDCRDGKYRRGEKWLPFSIRTERIHRRGKPAFEQVIYENDHGTLEGNPTVPGYCLATRWSCFEGTSADSLEAVLGVIHAGSMEEGRRFLGRLNNAGWNWVLADRAGNIGYQMSGKMPLRRDGISGLVPLQGWDPANDWQGFVTAEDLPRMMNPPQGFIATANQDLNAWGKSRPISLPMAAYRAERIASILSQATGLNVDEMIKLQFDLYSTQAERFMKLFRPLLSEFEKEHAETCTLLASWDLRYHNDSFGASLFEHAYRALIEEVFGAENTAALGAAVVGHLLQQTPLFADFYGNFDHVLLSENSVWFGNRTREEIYRKALGRALQQTPKPYGETRQIIMRHLLFGGKLPRWLGFDRGPIPLLGSRATVHQGQIYRAGGRETTFSPSLRLVTNLSGDEMHTTLAGGPSDRRFSKWYANEIDDWLKGRYKVLYGYEKIEQK
ncbi:MAG: penicillin acylase family protein [Verrucomicrobiota bacterium]